MQADVDRGVNGTIAGPKCGNIGVTRPMAIPDKASQLPDVAEALQLRILIVLDQRGVRCMKLLARP